MVNGVVREEFEGFQRKLRFQKTSGWIIAVSVVLLMILPVYLRDRIFTNWDINPKDKMLIFMAAATSPLFCVLGKLIFDGFRVEKLYPKLVRDSGVLDLTPVGTKVKLVSHGVVQLTLPNGQVLESPMEEIVEGAGRWLTSKRVKGGLVEAMEWYNQNPASARPVC